MSQLNSLKNPQNSVTTKGSTYDPLSPFADDVDSFSEKLILAIVVFVILTSLFCGSVIIIYQLNVVPDPPRRFVPPHANVAPVTDAIQWPPDRDYTPGPVYAFDEKLQPYAQHWRDMYAANLDCIKRLKQLPRFTASSTRPVLFDLAVSAINFNEKMWDLPPITPAEFLLLKQGVEAEFGGLKIVEFGNDVYGLADQNRDGHNSFATLYNGGYCSNQCVASTLDSMQLESVLRVNLRSDEDLRDVEEFLTDTCSQIKELSALFRSQLWDEYQTVFLDYDLAFVNYYHEMVGRYGDKEMSDSRLKHHHLHMILLRRLRFLDNQTILAHVFSKGEFDIKDFGFNHPEIIEDLTVNFNNLGEQNPEIKQSIDFRNLIFADQPDRQIHSPTYEISIDDP